MGTRFACIGCLFWFFMTGSLHANEHINDFDGDGVADVVLYQEGQYRIFSALTQREIRTFYVNGGETWLPVVGDFTGDGQADLFTLGPDSGVFDFTMGGGGTYLLPGYQGEEGHLNHIALGGDFDGDAISDIAIRDIDKRGWKVFASGQNDFSTHSQFSARFTTFGLDVNDVPVAGDYNGDGVTDLAFYRESNRTWYVKNSEGEKRDFNASHGDGIQRIKVFANHNDIPVPADYDGDGITDIAFRKPDVFRWIRLLSSEQNRTQNTFFATEALDIPIPDDYDGDGKADLAVYRPRDGRVFIRRSSDSGVVTILTRVRGAIPALAPFITKQNAVVYGEQDTDTDGVNDYLEIFVYGSDINKADSDGDGLSDYQEVFQYQTSPVSTDSDGDGISDKLDQYPNDAENGNSENSLLPTTLVKLSLNLPSNARALDPALFDANDPATYHYATSFAVNDTSKKSHVMTLYFTRQSGNAYVGAWSSNNRWSVAAAINGKVLHLTNQDGTTLSSPARNRVGQSSPDAGANNGGNGYSAGILLFNADGTLDNLVSPDNVPAKAGTPVTYAFRYLTTEPLGEHIDPDADSEQRISIDFNIDQAGQAPTSLPTTFEVVDLQVQ